MICYPRKGRIMWIVATYLFVSFCLVIGIPAFALHTHNFAIVSFLSSIKHTGLSIIKKTSYKSAVNEKMDGLL